MPTPAPHPLETYLTALGTIRSTGGSTPELSFYPALAALLESVGRTLNPDVVFVAHPGGADDARPDGGLFARSQVAQGRESLQLLAEVRPAHGAVEVKGTREDARAVATGAQVRRYLARYRQVLVTNYREFVLVAKGVGGKAEVLETFELAADEAAFWRLTSRGGARAAAEKLGDKLSAYLRRAMLRAVPITSPAEVATQLAAYARQALEQVERSALPALRKVREDLEKGLGISFQGARGEHLFRSTLVQTLWYGTFAAWVLWSQEPEAEGRPERFDWKSAGWSLRVPVIRGLFRMVTDPAKLRPLGLVQMLDWTNDVLNRVEPAAFFDAFDREQAVQYFYEPFLEAFDPELRREMGVWYTPREVVEYQVERVDRVLRDELGVADGLAGEQVYVLDPCCGTGAYLVEVLRRIGATLDERGVGATLGGRLKAAATGRVMGFELMPAPFVVAHLQLGLLLQRHNAPLGPGADGEGERAAVYLTNALTGWGPAEKAKQGVLFEELEAERDAAERVKRQAPILVVLGNPPYLGSADIAVEEEQSLLAAYRTTARAPAPEGQGLNDPYVRFFRMAERRICDKTGRGVVCFISNFSWLAGSSHTGMRERLLDAFDRVWIDNLHGDSRETNKLTPDGAPDPSVFSTPRNPEGIRKGTAVATLVRREAHRPAEAVLYRDFWGRTKRADLLASKDHDGRAPYVEVVPSLALGLRFTPARLAAGYLSWPRLPDLFPRFVPGVQTKRDDVVTDIDRATLERRMRRYFDPAVDHEAMAALAPDAMRSTNRFDAVQAREHLRRRGMLEANLVPHVYRPFDLRWIYWEPETKLLGEKSPAYFPQVFEGNRWLVTQQRARRGWGPPQHVRSLGALHLVESSASMFPLVLRPDARGPLQTALFADGAGAGAEDAGAEDAEAAGGSGPAPRDPDAADGDASVVGGHAVRWNATTGALAYLRRLGLAGEVPALFAHALAVLHAPAYAADHVDPLRQDWARLPLPATAEALRASAALGDQVGALLDAERPVAQVTAGRLRPGLRLVGRLETVDGRGANPVGGDLALAVRWGTLQRNGIVMPGPGRVVERDYSAAELAAFAAEGVDAATVPAALGARTCDVYLNARVYWANVPRQVWEYEIGGYAVLRKWLSYRERAILGRDLTLDEVDGLTATIRRLAALRLLEPALDANYAAVAAAAEPWTADATAPSGGSPDGDPPEGAPVPVAGARA